jgi:hypothetical protein
MQNMEFKKEDGSPREAKYLKAQLTDPLLTPEDDGVSCLFRNTIPNSFTKYTCLTVTIFSLQISVTFWNENAAAVRRYPPGTPIELKSVQVNDWEGRLCLKATGVSEIKVCLSSQMIIVLSSAFHC